MEMEKAAPLAERTDSDLLNVILNSNAALEEKARAVLTVRENSSLKQQNRYLLIITLVASLATVIQAIPIISRLLAKESTAPDLRSCTCAPPPPPHGSLRNTPTSAREYQGGPANVR